MAVRNRFGELHQEIAAWRQDMHENPELLFDTHRTSGFVSSKLREFGCDDVVTGIGRTGVVGLIKGRKCKSGKVIGLRADMDALPIKEATGLKYASKNEGKMHACGHDGHTAMLLGAAKHLSETRNYDGTVAVIFQPAEEGGGGGKEMVEDGLMDRFHIQEVYGLHNMPGMPPDEFAIRPGPFFAAADTFTIRVTGNGGHAANPHEGIDTTLVTSHIVIALQSIVSRNLNPIKALVVSVTSFQTETDAFNVISEHAILKGTVRALNEDVRTFAESRLVAITKSTVAAFGAIAEVDYVRGYPVMINSEAETEHAADAARRVTGKVDTNTEQIMGAEDFSFMLNSRSGSYILLGNGDSAPVHHPKYNFNDEAIPAGCSWWVEVAESRMPVC